MCVFVVYASKKMVTKFLRSYKEYFKSIDVHNVENQFFFIKIVFRGNVNVIINKINFEKLYQLTI